MKKIYLHALFILIVAAAGFFSSMITGKKDGAFEQLSESVLKTQGVDIDLSPDDVCKP